MKPQHVAQQTTLGDLVVAAFARAEATTGDRQLVAWIAARDVMGTLTKSGRVELIRALASAERAFSGTISLRSRRARSRVRSVGASHRPMAAAG